jgi:D-alanyl-D-alanine carboxypeptidase (penicillin-binding protein 5/6)
MRIGTVRLLSATLGALCVFGTQPASAESTESTRSAPSTPGTVPKVSAREAYLMDATTGAEIFAKRETRRVPVASLTKIMTAYVVRRTAGLDEIITITKADVRHATTNGASGAGLRAGERLTVRDLLYALLLPSAADAAHALAERYGPGTDGFVARMNRTARALGLADTRYGNPDGLPSRGYSTARDQARLAQVVLRDPVIAAIVKSERRVVAKTRSHRAHVWRNTNDLLADGALGLKTGYTREAGYCLTFAAVRNDHTYIGVVLGEAGDTRRFTTARALLDWASRETPERPLAA